MVEQLQFTAMLHSLDFPGRTTLRAEEIAAKLGITRQHVLNHIEDGSLQAIDARRDGVERRCLRVPLESYRDWIVRRLTTPSERRNLLRDLPKATLRELRREIDQILAA